MTALLLRLGGPLQSWGTLAVRSERFTLKRPTRSGLIGMIAATRGHSRTADLSRYRSVRFDVRVDRVGDPVVDFHTVGGGRPARQTVPISSGGHRPEGQRTIVSRRHYLPDTVFTVALSCEDTGLFDGIRAALRNPRWAPYLGRRSCPPDGPLLLGEVGDGRRWLESVLPLARQRPRGDSDVAVDFLTDTAPPDAVPHIESDTDEPVSFDPDDRAYLKRDVYRYRKLLPAGLCAGYGIDYLDAVAAALEEHR